MPDVFVSVNNSGVIVIKLWCWFHGRQCWHVRGIDGVPRCLECCLLDNPVFVPPVGKTQFPPS